MTNNITLPREVVEQALNTSPAAAIAQAEEAGK